MHNEEQVRLGHANAMKNILAVFFSLQS